MNKYHVTFQGKILRCTAKDGNCPYSSDRHFDNKIDAYDFLQAEMSSEYGQQMKNKMLNLSGKKKVESAIIQSLDNIIQLNENIKNIDTEAKEKKISAEQKKIAQSVAKDYFNTDIAGILKQSPNYGKIIKQHTNKCMDLFGEFNSKSKEDKTQDSKESATSLYHLIKIVRGESDKMIKRIDEDIKLHQTA